MFISLSNLYHNLVSPTKVKQNLCTLTWSRNSCVSIQLFILSKCASAYSPGLPVYLGLKWDQWNYGLWGTAGAAGALGIKGLRGGEAFWGSSSGGGFWFGAWFGSWFWFWCKTEPSLSAIISFHISYFYLDIPYICWLFTLLLKYFPCFLHFIYYISSCSHIMNPHDMYSIFCKGTFMCSLYVFTSRDYIHLIFYNFSFLSCVFSTTSAYIKPLLLHTTIAHLQVL